MSVLFKIFSLFKSPSPSYILRAVAENEEEITEVDVSSLPQYLQKKYVAAFLPASAKSLEDKEFVPFETDDSALFIVNLIRNLYGDKASHAFALSFGIYDGFERPLKNVGEILGLSTLSVLAILMKIRFPGKCNDEFGVSTDTMQ